jgi:AraC-like DNA-binding protein
MSGYREWAPPPALAGLVRCVWEREVIADGTVPVLPDGCIDLVVREEGVVIAGPDTRPAPTAVRAGERIQGLRFRPGAAGAALGVPAHELRDLRVALADVWGPRAGEPPDLEALGAAIARRAAPPDRAVLAAAALLARRPDAQVPAVAAHVGLSERQLRRRFADGTGLAPKAFARVARFQRALALARGGVALARVAADAGYADQAHLTREVRTLAGRPPSALAA